MVIDMSLSEDGIKGMLDEYEADHDTGMDTVEIAKQISRNEKEQEMLIRCAFPALFGMTVIYQKLPKSTSGVSSSRDSSPSSEIVTFPALPY